VIFGFALLASCSPCHDAWLNEWSSTPPVSSTMHALIAPPAAGAGLDATGLAGTLAAGAVLEGAGAGALVDGAGALAAGALLVGLAAVLDLLEHAVSMIATVPVAAMT